MRWDKKEKKSKPRRHPRNEWYIWFAWRPVVVDKYGRNPQWVWWERVSRFNVWELNDCIGVFGGPSFTITSGSKYAAIEREDKPKQSASGNNGKDREVDKNPRKEKCWRT